MTEKNLTFQHISFARFYLSCLFPVRQEIKPQIADYTLAVPVKKDYYRPDRGPYLYFRYYY